MAHTLTHTSENQCNYQKNKHDQCLLSHVYFDKSPLKRKHDNHNVLICEILYQKRIQSFFYFDNWFFHFLFHIIFLFCFEYTDRFSKLKLDRHTVNQRTEILWIKQSSESYLSVQFKCSTVGHRSTERSSRNR